MRTVTILLALAITSAEAAAPEGAPAGATAFVNGHWFDGRRFVAETVYVVDGRLQRTTPFRVAATVDLAGQFVVPPFAEGHNHNAATADPRVSERYLDAGVFYVKVPDNLPAEKALAALRLGRPETIDATFANGGLTGPGGHPREIAERAIARGQWTAADGEGAFYYEIADLAELDRKLPALLATSPDFVKTYLLYSEQFERRRGDPAFAGRRGLDPALLPEIVARAHRAGRRVTAHVESAADFHVAVAAGVDEIAHLPGFRGPDDAGVDPATAFAIAPEDARLAAERGVVVVTTIGGIAALPADGPQGEIRRGADALHAANLRLLLASGVRLAIGSDSYEETSVEEALYVHSLGVVSDATLLRIWCTETARAIFPERAIGSLVDGAEASFVVLAGDPLADFANVRRVALTVKSGVLRRPAPPVAAAAAPVAAAGGSLAVTVTWAGAGAVDAAHPLLVFLFDDAEIDAESVPIALARVESNGGTARFGAVDTDPVYVAVTYDPRGAYTGIGGPPPAGTPIGYYLVPGSTLPAAAHPGERLTIRFDGATHFGR